MYVFSGFVAMRIINVFFYSQAHCYIDIVLMGRCSGGQGGLSCIKALTGIAAGLSQ